jgi:hypothetical protein
MLRSSGCALLFSYVLSPRLPMLDERPPEEPPARAYAMAGAKATLAQKNNASMMRQFSSRLGIFRLAQKLRNNLNGCIWCVPGPVEALPNGISQPAAPAQPRGVETAGGPRACLIGQSPAPR